MLCMPVSRGSRGSSNKKAHRIETYESEIIEEINELKY